MTVEEAFEAGRAMARSLPPLTNAEIATLRVIFGTDKPARPSMTERKLAA
jgi:hypothetical protein